MPAPNRVTPFGSIAAIDQRGLFLGNRGCVHRAPHEIVRPWQVRRWITCALEYKGWVAPKWQPRRWTPLFFWDEAVAFAAGHRPCALCRHAAYAAWLDAWEAAFGVRLKADPMDLVLHADRVDGRVQRRHRAPWATLPNGTFVIADHATHTDIRRASATVETAALVLGDRLVPWSGAGYGRVLPRPADGEATVLTPRATVDVIRHGYEPLLHPSVSDRC